LRIGAGFVDAAREELNNSRQSWQARKQGREGSMGFNASDFHGHNPILRQQNFQSKSATGVKN
jgi:hypothetical protein